MGDDKVMVVPLPTVDVRPSDIDAERQTIHRILDHLEKTPSFDAVVKQRLDQYGNITPWIAWQLGCVAELHASEGRLSEALLTAYVSVNAAVSCRDSRRLLGNLLTVAGIHMRAGITDAAEQAYLTILELPLDDGVSERASAHLSLASILVAGRPREAVEHCEQGLCCLGERPGPEARLRIIQGMIPAFRALPDWVGLHYACKLLNLGDAQKPLREAIQSGLDLPQIIAADTRLRRLGANELADQLNFSRGPGSDRPSEKRKLNSIICCAGVPVAVKINTPTTRTRRHYPVYGATAAMTEQVQ